jgi:hypothetical protein
MVVEARGKKAASYTDRKYGCEVLLSEFRGESGRSANCSSERLDEVMWRQFSSSRAGASSDLSNLRARLNEHPKHRSGYIQRLQKDGRGSRREERKDDTSNNEMAALHALLTKWRKKRGQNATNDIKLPILGKKSSLRFERVDEVYDVHTRNWKQVKSSFSHEVDPDCVFIVRRRFDKNGSLMDTYIDIKSDLLHEALQEFFKDELGSGVVGDVPWVSSRALFYSYDRLRTYINATLRQRLENATESKEKRGLDRQIAQCELILYYIEDDYAPILAKVKAMLKAGVITYDLIWALIAPSTIAFTSTYGNKDEPRCYKVPQAGEVENKGQTAEAFVVKGMYLENYGNRFGMADLTVRFQRFAGEEKITRLDVFPLEYHKDAVVSARASSQLPNKADR